MYKNVLEIDIIRCLKALVKKKKFITIITCLFFLIGVGMTLDEGADMDKYTSVATVYAAADSSYSDSVSAVTVMNAYIDVANSYKVCQRAALILGRNDIDASDFQKFVSVNSSVKKTSSSTSISSFMNSSATIISFYATTKEGELSMLMADAMAKSYAIEMNSILNSDSIKLLDSADSAKKSYDANKEAWRKRGVATGVGIMFACFIVLLGEIIDKKVRTVREATIRDQIPVIGFIPEYKK